MTDIVGNITEVYFIICDSKFTESNLQAKHLKPHLRILHRYIIENVTPKGGHFDVVLVFNAYLLYYFEDGHKLDLCYILMKEIVVANLNISGRSLVFGALHTKIFKAFKIRLVGEIETKISAVISEYTLIQAGGGDLLLQSLNAPIDDPQHDENAMPPPQQPRY
ncbi:unnamed protein product [Camellia sinensis]